MTRLNPARTQPTMTTEGDDYDCDVCGGTHEVHRDRGGFPEALGFKEYYVNCPEYGQIIIMDS